MVRTGQAAIDAANAHVGINMDAAGYCLKFTRECFAVGSYYASAIDAWNGAKKRHVGDRNIPPAVPVFFNSSSVYEHVCISTENGTFVSTWNAEVRKYSSLAAMEAAFGPLFGWSEDLNGVTVYQAGSPDGGDDWLSYLSYDEQRRVLAWADQGQVKIDQVRTVTDQIKANTDRLPTIQATTDSTAAMATNNNNGIKTLLNDTKAILSDTKSIISTLASVADPTGRVLALVALIVIVAAIVGVLTALAISSALGGGAAGVGVLIGGLLGLIGGARGRSSS